MDVGRHLSNNNMERLNLEGGSGLVIVAHPDDETIWMGGVMLHHPRVRWTIFSLCRSDDPDRAPKFMKAAEHYGAKGIISNLEDEDIMNIKESVPEIKKRIKNLIPDTNFDYIFTHGPRGEYGHKRHKGVYRAVKDLLSIGTLKARSKFTFAYHLDEKKNIGAPDKKTDFTFNLSLDVLANKRRIIKAIYGFKPTSFEYKSCNEIEKFNSL